MIEFALTLPVMLLVVTGILTFGLALNNYISLTDATNTAARQLSISRGNTSDPCALVAGVVQNAAPFLTAGNISYTITLNSKAYSGSTCSSTSPTTGAAGNMVAGAPMTLQISYPCNLQVFRMNYVPNNCQLSAMTTEVMQ